MKKMMILAVMMTAGVCAQAQSDKSPVDAYFTTGEMPDMLKWCPAPPDTTCAQFAYDITQYFWGKQMRLNKERADIAIRDAEYGLDCIIREFSEPFGLKISKEETPEIYKVLREGTATCDSICTLPKRYYMRKRPFVRFHEQTLYPVVKVGDHFECELYTKFEDWRDCHYYSEYADADGNKVWLMTGGRYD